MYRGIFEKTVAVIDVNHYLTKPVEIRWGIRQARLLFVVILILVIESLLFDFENDLSKKSEFIKKLFVNASDTIDYVNSTSL